MDDATALAALGVTVRDTSTLEAEYRADWERAAELRRVEREQRKRGKQPQQQPPQQQQPQQPSQSQPQPEPSQPSQPQPPQPQSSQPQPHSASQSQSQPQPLEEKPPVAAAQRPAPSGETSSASGRPPALRRAEADEDEDAALARALSSQRSERLSVALRRSTGAKRRLDEDEDGDRSDDEYVPSDDAGEEEEEEEEEEGEPEGLDELEDGEIAQVALPTGAVTNGAVPQAPRRDGARKRRQERAQRLDRTAYESVDEEVEDEELSHGIRLPGRLWQKLYEHQRVCVDWLCGLHAQEVGGIIGDDMGLGKTLQVVSLFAALQRSGQAGACLVVAPATVLRQWKRELNRWAPEIKTVAILHSSGGVDSSERVATVRRVCAAQAASACTVLVTSYEMMRLQASVLLAQRWQYVVLDEGHKIRNPDAEVTLVAKRFNTGHRLILTGAPIQNRLNELWSLFDFVFPGRLGTLPTFDEQFALPIASGAYANASNFKVQAAYQCSVVLRDLIRPYLLRRTKADVQLCLPDKSEQVLFCQLTDEQRDTYELFLRSDLVARVLMGRANAFSALTSVLKVCNHPHLLNWDAEDQQSDVRYGDWQLSGKMSVMRQVLSLWHGRGDRALVFCQTRQMLDIVQAFVAQQYTFRRLDGTTPVSARLHLIDEYNEDTSIFAFLLTTRAGGLGINLTGANRVLLMDPDWNPANDLQARERAYRIGQQRAVTVYRLVTAGTLEEKVYQRQVFKQVLSNNVLKDPKQTRRVFKPRDLRDLLAPPVSATAAEGTETADLFASAEQITAATEEAGAGGSVVAAATHHGGASSSSSPGPARAALTATARPPSAGSNATVDGGDAAQAAAASSGETGFLSRLLRGELVASALDHDAVVGDAAQKPSNNTAAVEAKRVAERAAASLQDSFERRRHDQLSVPTWTGRNGSGGLPRRFGSTPNPALARSGGAAATQTAASGSSSFFAQTQGDTAAVGSASLLERIRERQEATGQVDPEAQASRVLQRLCAFLARRGGRASSAQLVSEFQSADVDARLLKSLLKQCAAKDAGGSWVLKPSFNQQSQS